MKSRDVDILIIPGLGGSGPDHWQTRWQAKLSRARRVEQRDWDNPVRAEWVARIAEAIAEATRPVLLLAHSLGVFAAGQVLFEVGGGRVIGAFLVAPPERAILAGLPQVDRAFLDHAAGPLPCPSILVASTDDPYGTLKATEALATGWSATLLNAGAAGHINTESGHGPWPEGLMALAGFLSKL